MDASTRRTRPRPTARGSVEVLQLAPRPRLPSRTVPHRSASPSAPPPPEVEQLAAIARELGRWWI